MNLAFNQESQFLLETTPMKITRAENNSDLETLNCRIVEVVEEQFWDTPAYPTDDAEFRNDTIYRHPQRVSVRVFVKSEDIPAFESNIKEAQTTANTFCVYSMYNKVYKNLKVVSLSRVLNADMIGACHYMLDLQEVIFVKALAQNYTQARSAGYANQKDAGTKNVKPIERKSTLKSGVDFGKGLF